MHAWLVHATKLAAVCTKPPMTRHADLHERLGKTCMLYNIAFSFEGILTML